jgi:hypothetical protein
VGSAQRTQLSVIPHRRLPKAWVFPVIRAQPPSSQQQLLVLFPPKRLPKRGIERTCMVVYINSVQHMKNITHKSFLIKFDCISAKISPHAEETIPGHCARSPPRMNVRHLRDQRSTIKNLHHYHLFTVSETEILRVRGVSCPAEQAYEYPFYRILSSKSFCEGMTRYVPRNYSLLRLTWRNSTLP